MISMRMPGDSFQSVVPPPRRNRRITALIVFGLLVLWLGVMWYRMEIRAQWWAWRITQVEDPALRGYYAACLSAVGDRSLGAVSRLLNDPRDSMRLIGVRVLRSCKNPRALRHLLQRLDDPSIDVSDAAALQIALRADADDSLPALQAMVSSNGPATLAALATLERIGGSQAEGILLGQLTSSEDPDVVAQAIDSLGMLGCQAAESAIRGRLNDTRPLCRLPATQRRAEQVAASLSGSLIARGVDPTGVAAASQTERTVAAVAARALAAIQVNAATQPASSLSPPTGEPSR